MRIFCDFHHGGLGRALWYLFGDRLGHTLYWPGIDLALEAAAIRGPGTWSTPAGDHIRDIGGVDLDLWRERTVMLTPDMARSIRFDAIIVSRPESQDVVRTLGMSGPQIAYSGNERMHFAWDEVRGLIHSDARTQEVAPPGLPRIHVAQEIGRQYTSEFVAVNNYAYSVVASFINALPFYRGTVKTNGLDAFGLWENVRRMLLINGFDVRPYGHANEKIGGVCIDEKNLAAAYHGCACVLHFKPTEGYGHSVLQAAACGRMPFVQRGFFADRTAGRFLVDGTTCIECEWRPLDIVDLVKSFMMQDLEEMNRMNRACFDRFAALTDWPGEAEAVRLWLDQVL